VIATDTAGQREVLEQYPAVGRLIPSKDPLALSQAMEDLLQAPEKLTTAKAAALIAAKEQFCWEQQVMVLLQTAELALVKKNLQKILYAYS